MSGIFNASIFNKAIFNTGAEEAPVVVAAGFPMEYGLLRKRNPAEPKKAVRTKDEEAIAVILAAELTYH